MSNLKSNSTRYGLLGWLFALTVFTSAFLLFQVQPMMAKFILPWFGGTPSVWSTCLLFFQTFLLAGYAYAHLLNRNLSPQLQTMVHIGVLALTACFLDIIPGTELKPIGSNEPALHILQLLMLTVGLPYFLLATTGPLLQAWFSMRFPSLSPYRLYSLSNVGSLLALLTYPFLVEPKLTVYEQGALWAAVYALFLVLCCMCAISIFRLPRETESPETALEEISAGPPAPSFGYWLLWFALAACGSVLLLAITNHVCQDVAVVPFLWIAPLSIYLLTFIFCFESDWWYRRRLFLPSLAMLMLLICDYEITGAGAHIGVAIGVSFLTLFTSCMVCHGELTRIKPHPKYLTSFYLMISAGGAFGGLFVSIISPLIFPAFFELHVGLISCAFLVLVVLYIDPESAIAGGQPRKAWAGLGFAFAALALALGVNANKMASGAIEQSRNFYGILRATELDADKPELHRIAQYHGRIQHGFQYVKEEKQLTPTAYYREGSGGNDAFKIGLDGESKKVGLIGMGTGTMAVFGRTGDTLRFYEINPQVVDQAERLFSFLKKSSAKIEIVMGDARLSLERESSQNFDLFIIDAFSGDAIPAHLLTREAFQIYLRHLKPGGLIAIHITNHHLDLRPVIAQIARLNNLNIAIKYLDKGEGSLEPGTTWMLLSTDQAKVEVSAGENSRVELNQSYQQIRLWTDDFSNLFQILK
ncbi:MAG: fused MFS/spermidine synthase [Bdellovibrionales bacterium]|nr:fused MFS/spermidine synthase [Bdellovibrionales bacterium]